MSDEFLLLSLFGCDDVQCNKVIEPKTIDHFYNAPLETHNRAEQSLGEIRCGLRKLSKKKLINGFLLLFKEYDINLQCLQKLCQYRKTSADEVALSEEPHRDGDSKYLERKKSDNNSNVPQTVTKETSFSVMQIPNDNQSQMTIIRSPIISELQNHTIQSQINHIKYKCPFMWNNVEILCELRNENYDSQACIEYFMQTRKLRETQTKYTNLELDKHTIDHLFLILFQHKNLIPSHSWAYGEVKDVDKYDMHSKFRVILEVMQNVTYPVIAQFTSMSLDDTGTNDSLAASIVTTHHSSPPCPRSCAGDTSQKATPIHSNDVSNQTTKIDTNYHKVELVSPMGYKIVIPKSIAQGNIFGKNKEGMPKFNTLFEGVRNVSQCSQKSLQSFKHFLANMNEEIRDAFGNIQAAVEYFFMQQIRENEKCTRRYRECVAELESKLVDESRRRQREYNVLQEKLGNVRVYCRCITDPESCVNLDFLSDTTLRVRNNLVAEEFVFNKIFMHDASQESVFEEFRPLITSLVDGYNICFITYGGEATGKTFTLHGHMADNEHGLAHRAISLVLREMESRCDEWQYTMRGCVLEIYNDHYFDGLTGRRCDELVIDRGLREAFVVLKSVTLGTPIDIDYILRMALSRRKTAKTSLNPLSSRSHMIHLIQLVHVSRITHRKTVSYMGLYDLAGFEDVEKADTVNSADRRTEARFINKSLCAFNRVFSHLRKNNTSGAPYRDSKLTHSLKPFLSNHSKCCLIATIRADNASVSTTQGTLRFGSNTRQIVLGKPVKCVTQD